MGNVQATEAKAQLTKLLRPVDRGEGVAITRHGKTVAHLVPADRADDEARRAAVASFRARRRTWEPARMTTEEILAARHEGHRA